MITDTAGTGVVADQPALAIAQAPSFCRLCQVELRGLQTWRAHVKSDGHVHNLRQKVADPGSDSRPSTPLSAGTSRKAAARRRDHVERTAVQEQAVETSTDKKGHHEAAAAAAAAAEEEDDEDDEESDEEPSAPEFDSGRCLFCSQESSTLEENTTHMSAAHSFTVPFQDCLAVDLDAVLWYLHFVIYGYRECICCGTQRSTVEGVQQHMAAKGHCRFDVSPDTEDFYEMPQTENVVTQHRQRDGDSDMPVRLPSGKLISHRRGTDDGQDASSAARRAAWRLDSSTLRTTASIKPNANTSGRGGASAASAPASTSTEVVAQRPGTGGGQMVRSSEAILAAQLSRLRVASQRAQHKEEERKRGRLERTHNTVLMKHFKLDAGDGRIGRQF